MAQELHVVTGAFGYSGKYIAKRLLAEGQRVRTLTNSMQRPNPFGNQVEAYPYNFDSPDDLVESLRGAEVLYNTYWVRFNYSFFKYQSAVRNTLILFEAAHKAGVKRIIHIGITNPSKDSPLEYFAGKAARPFCLHLKNDKIGKLGIEMLGFDQGIREVKNQREKINI